MILRGSSVAHAVWADLNAGELVEPSYEMPPPPAGSGKLVTPCERMHREYARAWPASPAVAELDVDGAPLDPHAATASAHAPTKLATNNRVMRRTASRGRVTSA